MAAFATARNKLDRDTVIPAKRPYPPDEFSPVMSNISDIYVRMSSCSF